MMIVYEQIIMLLVLQKTDVEQAVAVDIERYDQRGFHGLDGGDIFDGNGKTIARSDGLNGFAVVVQFDAREQRGMGSDSRLNGTTQAVAVETTV